MNIKKWFLRFILLNFNLDEIKKEGSKAKGEVKESWTLLAKKKRKIEEIEEHCLKLKWTDKELKKERKRLAKTGAKEIVDSFVFN